MQMGFNNTVEHGGRKYHIQTEDLGLRSAKITAQVFRDGAILDTLTLPYSEKITGAPDEDTRDEAIRHTMRLVHKACFRNIQNGKYDPGASAAHGEDDDEPMVLDSADVEPVDLPEAIEGFAVAGDQDDFEPEYLEAHSRGAPMDLAAEGFEEVSSLDELHAVAGTAPGDDPTESRAEPVVEVVHADDVEEVILGTDAAEPPGAIHSVDAGTHGPGEASPPTADELAPSGPTHASEGSAPVVYASEAPSDREEPAEISEAFTYDSTARAFRGLPREPDVSLRELLHELLAS